MSGRFVRASKYRHVFGRPTRKEQCYDNLRISKNAWDTNLVKANPLYLSVNWEASGGGAFAVIPLHEKGKLPDRIPLFRGHTAPVLDTDWSPFDDTLVASGSDDAKVFLWKVPDNFTLRPEDEDFEDVEPFSKLTGHSRKIGHVQFNPAAENVLASSSGDYTIKLWDIESGSSKLTLKLGDIVQSLSWSANGSLLVSTSRDKKFRIWDVRQEKPAQEVPGHSGAKNSRAVWMGEHDRVATTGFSKMSDRQLGLWDIRNAKGPIGGFQTLDSISGVCMPFWDDGTQCLYLAGKGDGNIRYFEYENDKFEFLSEYKSSEPQRGMAFVPKRGVNTHENEVMRAYKTVNDVYIEPISFIVPRRAEVFQEDIFPPAVGSDPAVSAKEWFQGSDGLPAKIDLQSLYDGKEPVPVPAEPKPAPPAAKEHAQEEKKPKPAPTASTTQQGSPPSMKDTKNSISNMVDKFADGNDNEEESSDDDEDGDHPGFNEAPAQGAQRILPVSAKAEPSHVSERLETVPAKDISVPRPPPGASAQTTTPRNEAEYHPTGTKHASSHQPSSHLAQTSSSSTADSSSKTIQSSLDDIKALLERQNRTIADQTHRIGQLTAEVDMLKSRVGGGGGHEGESAADGGSSASEKDARIRELERELQEKRAGF